ncbi:MAG: TonB-dependent receptor [Acidobacteriota bacterium]|nr:TonB-dependent receptor [Acidobacteriota bacterium]
MRQPVLRSRATKGLARRRRGLLPIAVVAFLLGAGGLRAQASGEGVACDLDGAEDSYRLGRFDLVLETVGECYERLRGRDRTEAEILLAKAHLGRDEFEMAETWIARVLDELPAYEPARADPPRLKRLVAQLKSSGATVVVSSVSKTSESLREAPATVEVITGEQIARRGYLDLAAVLHDLPGFDISRGNGILYSNVYPRGYRSDSTDRTLFLVDGVEENDLWSNIAYVSRQYPLRNIERVEVIYGPATTMYGPNAFVGVINVITKDPENLTPEGESFFYDVEVGGAELGTSFVDALVAGRVLGKVAFSLAARTYTSDELDLSGFSGPRFLPGDPATPSSVRYWDYDPGFYDLYFDRGGYDHLGEGAALARDLDKAALSSLSAPLRFSDRTDDWLIHGRISVSRKFTAGFQTWRREEGFTSWFTDQLFTGADSGTLWIPSQLFFYAKYADDLIPGRLGLTVFSRFKRHKLADGTGELQLRNYSKGSLDAEDLANGIPAYFQTTEYSQSSQQFRNEITLNWRPSSRLSLVGGLEVRTSQIQGDYNLRFERPAGVGFANAREQPFFCVTSGGAENCSSGQSFDQTDIGVFAQASYRLSDRWKLVAGGRLDDNHVSQAGRDVLGADGEPVTVSGYGTVLNPRLGLIHLRDRYVVKAIYSEAFKDASNFNRYATAPSTRELQAPDLAPEKVKNLELSVGWQPREDLDLDLAYYRADYSAAVAIEPFGDSGTGRNVNRGGREISGLQATASWQRGAWDLYANYTFTDPKGEVLSATTQTLEERRIGDIASHRANAGANYHRDDGWNFNLRANFVGERPTGRLTTVPLNPLARIDSHFVLDGALAYRRPASRWSLRLSATNLLAETYSDPGVRLADGTFFASILPQPGRVLSLRVGISSPTGSGGDR